MKFFPSVAIAMIPFASASYPLVIQLSTIYRVDRKRIRRLSLRRLANRRNPNLLDRKHGVRIILRVVKRNLTRKPNQLPSLATA